MDDEMDELIERLTARAHDPNRAADEGQGRAGDPATEAQIAAAEARLGFALPGLLRQAYARIGDGGWGPGAGLPALAALPAGYVTRRQTAKPPRVWPEKLLPVCEWGGGIASCVDCVGPEARVIRVDPNMPKADEAARVPAALRYAAAGQIKDACWVESPSLQAWLEAWADGRPLFYLAYRGEEEDPDAEDEEDDEDEDAV